MLKASRLEIDSVGCILNAFLFDEVAPFAWGGMIFWIYNVKNIYSHAAFNRKSLQSSL